VSLVRRTTVPLATDEDTDEEEDEDEDEDEEGVENISPRKADRLTIYLPPNGPDLDEEEMEGVTLYEQHKLSEARSVLRRQGAQNVHKLQLGLVFMGRPRQFRRMTERMRKNALIGVAVVFDSRRYRIIRPR